MAMKSDNKPASAATEISPLFNPFPGLRPFTISESHLFFGREGQSSDVLRNLSDNRFVAVIGASGSGKSSLMYCGLVPVLHGGFITEAGERWKIVPMRPGNGPIHNLAAALAQNALRGVTSAKEEAFNIPLIESILRNSSSGLVNAVKHLDRPRNENLLILVDQFEELFRFRRRQQGSTAANEAFSFIKLLVEAVNQTDAPIYIVLTMRSDFIGECAQYQNLTELINKSHYLIPQMTRDNLRRAIEGPIAVGGGIISARLLHQLLNDVGDNPDQLPILQHALMRTWDYWEVHRKAGEPLDLAHYDAVGRMEKALSEHANEAYDELDVHGKAICEHLFKSLTERGADNRGIRRPSSIEEIALIADSSASEVMAVANVFRKTGRSFISPSAEVELNHETVIDISHESLMRIWDRLKNWVDEEASAVQMYMRLSESAHRFQQGKAGLWRPPDLHLATSWRAKQKPTLSWALRYNPAFERTMVFLESSEKEYLAEEQNKVRLQKRALRRSRMVAIVLGSAAIVSLGIMVFAIDRMGAAQKAQLDALVSQELAVREKDKADSLRVIALNESQKAAQEGERARESALEAITQKEEALRQQQNAEEQRLIAMRKSDEASLQRNLAETNSRTAVEQRAVAETAKEQAFRLRMISVAQSMSVKSIQIEEEPAQKAALAYEAYLLNERFGGVMHNNDVYSGIYYALKSLRGANYRVRQGHEDAVRSLAFIPNSRSLFSAGSDGRVIYWDQNTQSPSVIFKNSSPYRELSINRDATLMVCSKNNGDIDLVQLSDTKKPVLVLKGHRAAVQKMAFVGKGDYLLTASMDSTLRIWEIGGTESWVIARFAEPVRAMSTVADGAKISVGLQSGKVINGSLAGFDEDIMFKQESSFTCPNPVYSLALSQSGNVIVTGDQLGNVSLWEVAKGTELYRLRGHKARISDIQFSPASDLLATASFDGKVLLWKTTDYTLEPIVLKDHESWVQTIAFSPDGTTLLTGSSDSKIKEWDINIASLAAELRKGLIRNLTKQEWDQYIGKDIPYEKLRTDLP